ncbi:MAG TPA: hypothetical protein VFZ09_27560 [Archangium sp.]|uniref:hypothetical protein n=1 Tax=Archangium sp. TaxID=1872627 RepID=UPI002E307AC5|nr:hypothetical protein [Archangium sp.]HEX5750018.1 hypothetical protein [Archangium sp.]
MHPTSTNIGAYLRTAGPSGAVQGYPPSTLSASTDYGDAFSVVGFKSAVLTASTGSATGGPTTQSTTVSLQSSTASAADGTWADVAGTTVTLTADEKSGEVDINLVELPSGHGYVRTKVVVAFTGGTAPEQAVAANLTLAGSSNLPV